MVKFPVLNLFGTGYRQGTSRGQGKALGPSGWRVGLRKVGASRSWKSKTQLLCRPSGEEYSLADSLTEAAQPRQTPALQKPKGINLWVVLSH